MTDITPKQERFCREYIVDLNGTQAAIRAGYSERSAEVTASRHLRNAKIAARIRELQGERGQRLEIDADYVLRRLHEIDQMDAADILDDQGNILPVRKWPEVWRKSISAMDVSELVRAGGDDENLAAVVKKIKWPDKTRNLELLGKHTNISAFRENFDHNHRGEVTSITRTVVDPAENAGS